MKFIMIVHRDSKGLVAQISELLGVKDINIDRIDAFSENGLARIKLHTSDNDMALNILNEAGYRAVPDNNILLKIEDRPGALARTSRLLSDNDIDIRSITMIERNQGENVVAIVTDNDEKARAILKESLLT
ncbi:putative Acetolactate synthase, small subunit [Desulfamplus magnetovallimortis]|uniref:Putative Acetolactate synthase, small subunit n=1 Tax=Desulfamplus magnetovallimortis TaxID=1246637 RepID=A0A1W1HB90_9BACT|nr:ACT domain-containing protein [Desulfamplus magnetovallimortis]SLM29655.1 putative Acetolactate synthase, small subunit [Desulfamplus magnetovallimortis]